MNSEKTISLIPLELHAEPWLKSIVDFLQKQTQVIQEQARVIQEQGEQIASLKQGSLGKSKYTIMLLQEYVSINAFDVHCKVNYVTNFFKKFVENETASVVTDWRCRFFWCRGLGWGVTNLPIMSSFLYRNSS